MPGPSSSTPAATSGPPTARCLILITPDAQRTMNTFLGACVNLGPDDIDEDLVGHRGIGVEHGQVGLGGHAHRLHHRQPMARADLGHARTHQLAAAGDEHDVVVLVDQLRADLLRAEAELTTAQADLEDARLRLSFATLRAPDAGVIAATLSSAMASFMGAPRILQSLAADRIFNVLTPFAAVSQSGNPRRGVLLSAAIAFAATPKTTFEIPAQWIAPAHIRQGSRVT